MARIPSPLVSYLLTFALFTIVPPAVGADDGWASYGIGGGGALFSVSMSPHDPREIYMATDMSSVFRSRNFGQSWETLDFRRLMGGHNSHVRFTADEQVLYAVHVDDDLNYGTPVRSSDGGTRWSPLPGDPTSGEVWWLDADPGDTQRVLISDYSALYYSDSGGAAFTQLYSGNDLRIAGSFWGSREIFVATQEGLLVSSDSGTRFNIVPTPGIPTDEIIVGFAGAESDSTTRLIAITADAAWPGITPGDLLWNYRGVYRIDWGNGGWQSVDAEIGDDDGVYFAGMAQNDIDSVYLAGGNRETYAPIIYKSDTGGSTWNSVFRTENNANIATGWCGDGGDEQWWFPEYAMGFAVSPSDSRRAVISDFGFVHVTDDSGQNWRQAYVRAEDQNPAGSTTPRGRAYRGVGLQQTSVWWLHWSESDTLTAAFTDIQGMRSTDGGLSWQAGASLGLPHNSTYHIVQRPGSDTLYAATSSVHDIYQSTYLEDELIDRGEGQVIVSHDKGATWRKFHDFGKPVIWLAVDPNNPNRLYASAVNSETGGIYVTDELSSGSAADWRRLATPPRTRGHPFNVHVLNDGTLVATYSGHINDSGEFAARSGVFVSDDDGESWEDRSHPDMQWWTKDLTIDPHDSAQNTWLVSVFRHWGGGHEDVGGLYRSTDRGRNWTRISDLPRVESVTIDPQNENNAWLATETLGLWKSENFSVTAPLFTQDPDYPFRHPLRVFINPHDREQVWVASFGGGMRARGLTDTGSGGEPPPVSGPVTVSGTIRNSEGAPLCALALANGSYQFTCGDDPGNYRLKVAPDNEGRITLFGFVDGMAPFRRDLTPTGNDLSVDIQMIPAPADSRTMTVSTQLTDSGSGRVRITGDVTAGDTPVCALILANGIYQFSCGDTPGHFDFPVPIDPDNQATLFTFADGFLPYRQVFNLGESL